MSVSDGFLACGFFVYVCEWEVYFDEFFAVFGHGVRWFVVVNRYRIIDYFWRVCWLGCIVFTLCSQCQALGQALIPLLSRERGNAVGVVLLCALPLTSGLRIKSAMTGRGDGWCFSFRR